MSAAVLPDEGIAELLDYMLRAPITGVLPWGLLLWCNDIEPSSATVLSDLQEATFEGYGRRTLDREQWSYPVPNVGCCKSTYGTELQVYDVGYTAGETVYGLAYVDVAADVLRWVQRFDDEDIRPLLEGQQLKFLPEFTLTTAECASELTRRRRVTRARKKT